MIVKTKKQLDFVKKISKTIFVNLDFTDSREFLRFFWAKSKEKMAFD
jgi:hypothetical protein